MVIRKKPTPDELLSLKIVKGILWHKHKYVDQREYVVKNKADKQRTVLLEQPYSEDWKLITPKEPYERTRNLLRFKVDVSAMESTSYKVQLERVAEQRLALLGADMDVIRFYLRAQVISPMVKEALEKLIKMRAELSDATHQRTILEQALDEVVEDQKPYP